MHGRAGETITVARNKDTECERASDKERTKKKKQGITNVLNKLYGLLLWHKPHVCACEAYNANMRISEPSKTQRICIESATKCKASTDEKISNIIHDGRRWFYVGSFFRCVPPLSFIDRVLIVGVYYWINTFNVYVRIATSIRWPVLVLVSMVPFSCTVACCDCRHISLLVSRTISLFSLSYMLPKSAICYLNTVAGTISGALSHCLSF